MLINGDSSKLPSVSLKDSVALPKDVFVLPAESPRRKQRRSQQLLEAVLTRAIPSAPPRREEPSNLCKDPPVDGKTDVDKSKECEVQAFRKFLAKGYGTVIKAFRMMKLTSLDNVGQGLGSHVTRRANRNQLTAAEFEWCVTYHLKYGDRQLASRLFKSLDQRNVGSIGVSELAQEHMNRGHQHIYSLVEFRRRLLDRYPSLPTAFQELEDFLKEQHPGRSDNDNSMNLSQFIEASAFFGLQHEQAAHLFAVLDMDGTGDLTHDEFLRCLTSMPRPVLLQDFRQRLLSRYPSVLCALRGLIGSDGDGIRMDRVKFSSSLFRIGISEMEAAELFRLIDADDSGDVSFGELRNAIREGAPDVDLKVFFQRFVSEWPEYNEAKARRGSGLMKARERLGHMVTSATPNGIQGIHAATSINFKAFDVFANRLDVSSANAVSLFQQMFAATKRVPPPVKAALKCFAGEVLPGAISCEKSVSSPCSRQAAVSGQRVYIDDFLDQLHLWAPDALSTVSGGKAKAGVFDSIMRPLRAAIGSLKADIQNVTPALVHSPAQIDLVPARLNFAESWQRQPNSKSLDRKSHSRRFSRITYTPVMAT